MLKRSKSSPRGQILDTEICLQKRRQVRSICQPND